MYKAIILPSAKSDIEEAAVWYQKAKDGLGKKFTNEIRNKVGIICRNPLIFVIGYKTVRTATLTNFPFLIHYQIDTHLKTILIIAVLHTSRNPEMWSERIRE